MFIIKKTSSDLNHYNYSYISKLNIDLITYFSTVKMRSASRLVSNLNHR